MGELAEEPGEGLYRFGVAGDSFNTAVYLARAGLSVEFLTLLGDDILSDTIMARLAEEGIDGSRIGRLPGRQAGLYLISNDPDGERHFTYWRDHSPARNLFDRPVDLPGVANFYFTGITLAVCRNGIANLVDLLGRLRRTGCSILFDPNYRPGLWDTVEQAQEHFRQVLPLCDMVLPTLEDDLQLWAVDEIEGARRFYAGMGVKELVIKAPGLVTHVWSATETVEKRAEKVLASDTTGAGDSFNAGYLSVRLRGGGVEEAIAAAQSLSARVVQHRGAIIPRSQQ
jgi:2-dehydro-3-deoxygluconokinase